jgi:CIC family chloride channel protein
MAQTDRQLHPLSLSLISILIGAAAGLGAVGFRALIAIIHNLTFLGFFSASYDANAHTPASPWGPFVILVPVAGAIGVAFLVKNFAPEVKGHGVPEVMDAIYHEKGVIRPLVAAIKALASALSIGTGGSVGREGPIIQIGASFGSTLAQSLRLTLWQRITLVAAGAAGGIAATFNTPVGGVLFAVEIMMHEVSVRTLVPVAIATATATYVGQLFFGPHPSFVIPVFEIPYFHVAKPLVLVCYLGLGMVMGIVSALFIWALYFAESFFEERVPGGYYVQHLLGMAVTGALMYGLMVGFGHYYVEGVGYSTIEDILSSHPGPIYLLLILFAAKLIATSLTLGSGASGGIFSPALYLGATLGAAYGIALNRLLPGLGISPPAFAVVGMGAVVGASTSAAMAAIVMIFEMTLDYRVILPMTITVATSYAVRKLLVKDSIYTRKIRLRGHDAPEALHANVHFVQRAMEIMETDFDAAPEIEPVVAFVKSMRNGNPAPLLLTGVDSQISGVVIRESGWPSPALAQGALLKDVSGDYVIVTPEASFLEILGSMRSAGQSIALVSSKPGEKPALLTDVRGVITEHRLIGSLAQTMELSSS